MVATELQLYGAGGHAKVLFEACHANGGKIIRVVDDDPNVKKFFHLSVEHPDKLNSQILLFIAIGSNVQRQKVAVRLTSFAFGKVIHPSAIISPTAIVGNGTCVMPGAVINAEAKVDNHCIVNSGAIIEHHVQLDKFVHVGPGAVLCGEVRVGSETLVGANSCVLPGRQIGNKCTIGSGSIVTRDLPDGCVVVGNPARIIRSLS